MTHVLAILAAGGSPKWPGRHLVDVGGERLIERTIRQFSEHGRVTVKLDTEFESSGDHDADAFLSSQPLWPREGRVIFVYGDAYFTDEAVARIEEPSDSPTWYGRWYGSTLTGSRWGELWAISFDAEIGPRMAALQRDLVEAKEAGILWRAGQWELYRAWHGIEPADRHTKPGPGFVEINDWTEDFDTPEEYAEWKRRRGA